MDDGFDERVQRIESAFALGIEMFAKDAWYVEAAKTGTTTNTLQLAELIEDGENILFGVPATISTGGSKFYQGALVVAESRFILWWIESILKSRFGVLSHLLADVVSVDASIKKTSFASPKRYTMLVTLREGETSEIQVPSDSMKSKESPEFIKGALEGWLSGEWD